MGEREERLEARLKALEARLASMEQAPEAPQHLDDRGPVPAGRSQSEALLLSAMGLRPNRAQWAIAGLILVLAGFVVFYRVLAWGELEQTALLFVGLPAFLGAFLALLPRATSFVGMSVKGTLIALLMSSIVLQEGFICVLMASPIFLSVSVGAGALADITLRRRGTPVWLGWAALLLAAGEGAVPGLAFDRAEVVTAERIVPAPPEAVRAALARPLDVRAPLPPVLRIGWPAPVDASGGGLEVGARRVVHFAGGEGSPGDMVLRVVESRDDRVVFEGVEDRSHLAHWLTWKRSVVELAASGSGTRVRWTVEFDRELDPAWYFAPLERAVVRQAAEWLISTSATP